ncbi:hypothetical protein TWF730_000089 [Orbilia blumenaviensis]|uniref:F-box domain-containing protein n=1 Tax=Orbilia blumenaviensis TaxID=1796055 RepID=A0AAV9VKH2_9PEZI
MRRASRNQSRRRFNPFDIFPAELNLLIIERLGKRDLYNLSRCSRLCYVLCFPLRWLNSGTIVLTPQSTKLFKNGGLCEHLRSSIRSINFNRDWSWSKAATDPKFRRQVAEQHGRDIEQIVTELRTKVEILRFFPNIQELSISYIIPPALENNIYAAVIDTIAGPSLCNTLDFLELQIYKDDDFGRFQPYETIVSTLSPENQDFLGEHIPDDKIDALIREKITEFPGLAGAHISVNGLCTPLVNSKTRSWEGSTFYYIPLTAAPNLQNLWIETKDESRDSYKKNTETIDEARYPDPSVLHCFSSVTELQIVESGILSKEKIDSLAERFPNLVTLDISQIEPSRRDDDDSWTDSEQEHRYDGISALKCLADLSIVWPAYKNSGSIPPDQLLEWIYRWIKNGLNDLEAVAFLGMRRRLGAGGSELWDELTVTFAVNAPRKEVIMHMRGENWYSQFGDTSLSD